MKNIFKYTLIAGVTAIAMSSCDLEVLPETSIVNDVNNSAITQESDLTSLTNGLLASFRSCLRGDNWGVEEIMYGYFNACSDYGNNYGSPHRLEDNIADDYDIRDFWQSHYTSIKNDNVFLQAANTCKVATLKSKINVSKGYAFLFRAVSYIELTRHFGVAYNPSSASSDLGVPLVTVFDLNAKPARSTVQECYDQIKADLDSAAVLLADQKGAVASLRPTIDCVNAAYARYYLDTQNYSKAAEYAEKVITSAAGYALLSTDQEFDNYYFHEEKGKNSEAIMQMYISESETGVGYSMFTSLSNYTSQGYGYVYIPYFLPAQALIDLYDEDDYRFVTWFNNDKRYVRQNASFYMGDFYVFNKFEGNVNWTTAKVVPAATTATRPFTLPEMYLIAAESYIQQSNTQSAAKYLNDLQQTRNAEPTAATLANIQKEWDKETVGEGMRLSNLKRWKLGFEARTPQLGALENHCVVEGAKFTELSMSGSDFHLTWPIPTYELQVNDNLVQNSGYTVAD